ncbi:ABC transporter ATP-binding protein [Truepera radiovictrix]|uniref:Glycine betaine/L-proline ABC transporter, ATPase subunit n=1 Tax=Truepera radiovictrix (strain DSM 17093 / CIP 108686 / LMG 22925 / RQ-24) TaxID=649638 RepID=D7CY52_TRURR|nr:ABC transporter ATP-binding protein [Truepera radiovictrix]ADI14691.1 glycine betaine/L-proline ABC transporter, ATPase subunit [Truepera radiovictrix DSM 17093]WMT56759.1 ABC transporter ATP-binding protein [Truepera radiovictrix]
MADAMIRLERVSKRYGETVAVQETTLEIPEGELVVLIGPSGCGKTTTLKMINRLIEPSSGRIYIGGRDVTQVNPQELRRGIGYVIQSIGLFPHMSVRENIQVVPRLLGWPKARSAARADELLELVGLPPERYAAAYPRELSGGQAQRVGVARALAVDPPVLLMDEPFGAVDPLTRERLQDEFLKLQAQLQKTIVMVTHDIDEAIKLGDRVCVMNVGVVEQFGTPEEVLSAPKSRFVRQFVGADRALKRLSRVRAHELMRAVPTLDLGASREAAREALARHRTVYVTREGRLAGWLDRRAFAGDADVESAYTEVSAESYSVREGDDVRGALAKMLGQGVAELPVVDGAGRPIGLLNLPSILAVTGEMVDEPEASVSEAAPSAREVA